MNPRMSAFITTASLFSGCVWCANRAGEFGTTQFSRRNNDEETYVASVSQNFFSTKVKIDVFDTKEFNENETIFLTDKNYMEYMKKRSEVKRFIRPVKLDLDYPFITRDRKGFHCNVFDQLPEKTW